MSAICFHYGSNQATCTYLDSITSFISTTRVISNRPEGLEIGDVFFFPLTHHLVSHW